MADVSLTIAELLDVEPFSGAGSDAIPHDLEVYAATVMDGALLLLGADSEVVATVEAGPLADRSDAAIPRLLVESDQRLGQAHAHLTERLTRRAQHVAERSREILQSLTEADLQGRTLQEVVALLARLVGNPVVLKDPSYRVVASSGNPEHFDLARRETVEAGRLPDAVIEALDSRGILTRIRSERRPFRIEGDHRTPLAPRVVCPVRAGDTYFGYLSISEGGRRLDSLDFLAVEYGATVAAFHMSRERAVEESVRSQRALLIYELLFVPQEKTLPRRRKQAALMDFDIDQEFVVASIQCDRSAVDSSDPERWPRLLQSVVSTVDTTLDRLGVTSSIAMAEDDGVLAVIPRRVEDLQDVIATLLREIEAYHRVGPMSAGISLARKGSERLGEGYEEARLAAELGRTLSGPGTITHYEELGALRLLNEISEELVERHLSATLTDDEAFREQFAETFGALVEAGYNKAAAARELYIHVNTLKYRLGRIRKVTGQDVADHHGRFALECTLRLLELRRARQGQS